MKSFEIMNRRRFSTGLAVLATGASGMAQALAAGETTSKDKFAALTRPALNVKNPQKSVLLAATQAGKRLLAVGERGLVVFSDDAGKTWQQAKQVPVSTTLTSVRFFDSENGLAVGHGGAILLTQNAGESWQLVAQGSKLASLAQTVAQAREAEGDKRAPQMIREAELLINDGPDKPLLDIMMLGGKKAAVVGAYNLFFVTADGGFTWTSLLDRLNNPKAKHIYVARSHGDTWMLAGEQGLLLRSTDAGRSFQTLKSPYEGSWFTLANTPNGEWILAGLRGNVFYSNDAGNSWRNVDGAPPVSFISSVTLSDGSVMLANQAGEIFITRAGGRLQVIASPALPPVSQALMVEGGEILTVGMGGAIRIGATKS